MVLAIFVSVVIMLLKPLVFATLFLKMSTVKCNINYFGEKNVTTMVLATLFLEMSTVKCNVNFVLIIVVKPMVLASLFLELL